jgi:hypothetical protein
MALASLSIDRPKYITKITLKFPFSIKREKRNFIFYVQQRSTLRSNAMHFVNKLNGGGTSNVVWLVLLYCI